MAIKFLIDLIGHHHHLGYESEIDGLGVAGGIVTIDCAAARFQVRSNGLELRIIFFWCWQLNEHLRNEVNTRPVATGFVVTGAERGRRDMGLNTVDIW